MRTVYTDDTDNSSTVVGEVSDPGLARGPERRMKKSSPHRRTWQPSVQPEPEKFHASSSDRGRHHISRRRAQKCRAPRQRSPPTPKETTASRHRVHVADHAQRRLEAAGRTTREVKKTRFCCFPFSAFRKNSQAKRQSTEHTPEELRKNRSSTSGFPIVPDKKHRTRILNRGLYRRRAVQCRACLRAGRTAPPGRCRRRREPIAFTLRGKRGKKRSVDNRRPDMWASGSVYANIAARVNKQFRICICSPDTVVGVGGC